VIVLGACALLTVAVMVTFLFSARMVERERDMAILARQDAEQARFLAEQEGRGPLRGCQHHGLLSRRRRGPLGFVRTSGTRTIPLAATLGIHRPSAGPTGVDPHGTLTSPWGPVGS
jgi:hypothetical protein